MIQPNSMASEIAMAHPDPSLRYSAVPSTMKLLLGTMLAFSLAACGPQAESAIKPLQIVKVAVVEQFPVAQRQQLTGSIQAHAETPLAFLTSGQLTELLVDVGSSVKRGDVVARIASAEQQADVEAAQAGLESSQARLNQAQTALDRQKSLWGQGLTTKSALDGAQTAWETARNSRDSANSQLNLVREALGYAQLRATADGIVIRRLYEVDEVVQVGAPVFVIAENGTRRASVNMQETSIARWPSGRAVKVALVSDPAISATGTVTEIAPALDATGTVPVKLGLEETPQLPLGAAVTVTFEWPASDRITLPAQAIAEFDGHSSVWVVDDADNVRIVPVEIESFGTGSVVIASGLDVGQRVVVDGVQFLAPGQAVEVLGATQ